MDKFLSIGICTATLLALGACGGGGKASASATAASASTSCPTTTTTTSSTGVVTVTVTPCPAASSPSTPASSPSTPASSPSTPASSPSTPASSPSTPASSPSTPASTPASATTAASGPYGLWNGSTSTGRYVYGLVLPDGNYYLFYTGAGTTSFTGVLMGHGTTTPGATAATGSFAAADPDAVDYSLEGNGAQSATMPNTQYATGASLTGTLHYASSDVNFSARYESSYGTAPTLASLAGTYANGGAAILPTGAGAVNLVFGTDGTITGSAANCDITGTATPRTDGNAFNITLNFGAAPCLLPGQTLTGAAFLFNPKQIMLAAPTSDRSSGFLVIANKP